MSETPRPEVYVFFFSQDISLVFWGFFLLADKVLGVFKALLNSKHLLVFHLHSISPPPEKLRPKKTGCVFSSLNFPFVFLKVGFVLCTHTNAHSQPQASIHVWSKTDDEITSVQPNCCESSVQIHWLLIYLKTGLYDHDTGNCFTPYSYRLFCLFFW